MKETDLQTIADWLDSGSLNLFGRPFAGKDTQGKLLADLFDGELLGGGEILRGSIIPAHVKEIMHAGKLVPINDFIEIVVPFLQHERLEGRPLILSSVGRWDGEQQGVVEATHQSGHPMKAVVYIDLSESLVRDRWNHADHSDTRGNRHDDTAEILETRLEEYRNKTLPVIEYYRAQGLLVEIDGNQAPEAVHQDILEALLERSRQN